MNAPRLLLARSSDDADRLPEAFRDAGWSVRTVETATAALAELLAEEFDCLVSAYSLAGDDGLELLSALEQSDIGVPSVLFAAADVEDSQLPEAAFEHGADSYVEDDGAGSIDRLLTVADDLRSTPVPGSSKQDVSEYEPEPEDLVRAIEAAPIGVSLSDPSLSDYPLVYVNDAWERFTGYEPGEILGRNPRLLQGPETDPGTIEELAAAVEREEPTTVEIRNYRRDGTPFWNELTIAPIHDDEGELAHYVGFQIDVSDRREAQALAEERSERLAEEQRTLRRILNRVSGLLSDVSRILVEATDRRVLINEVCSEIATEPGYTAAWIGTVDDGGLSIEATNGFQPDPPATVSAGALPAAATRAIETNDAHHGSRETNSGGPLDPCAVGARRLLVVPLCYGDRRYGLLGVYAGNADALDQREQQVFGSLGTMIANGIHAVETARILTTDQITELEIELHDETFHLAEIAAHLDAGVERSGATRSTDGAYVLYLTTDGSTDGVETLTTLPSVTDVREIAGGESAETFSVTLASATPYDELAECGAVVTESSATASGATLTVEAPPEQEVRTVLDVLRETYDDVELRARTQRDRRERRPNEFTAEVDEKLTQRQRDALEAAYLNGYFEWPRSVDGTEIAETMDITRQTFHQHLRAAEGKLVDAYIDA